MNRRSFLQAGAASLLSLSGARFSAAAEKPEERRVFLFVDWFHVKKGDLAVVLDPARKSEAGRKLQASLANDFNRRFDIGTDGYRAKDFPSGVRIVQEKAQRSEPFLTDDQPWERTVNYSCVIHEEGRYRCWYHAPLRAAKIEMAAAEDRGMEIGGSALAYAESTDGVHWKKPALGIVSYAGSTQNNLVSPYSNGGCVCRDDHGPATERYKLFYFHELPKNEIPPNPTSHQRYGLFGAYSADGFRWKMNPKPLVRHFSDTQNIVSWDPLLGKYVGYFRDIIGGRAITRAETEDFWNWPVPQAVLYAGPMDSPFDDLYFNGYTTYPDDPSLRLMFVSMYHHDSDGVDVRLAISREGRSYNWLAAEPIIELGTPGSWNGGSLYAYPNLVHLPDGRLALPCGGKDFVHNEAWFSSFYKDFPTKGGVGWATWADGRLAGIVAGGAGEFTTTSAPFRGSEIQINARTQKAGRIVAELRERGTPIPGFTFAESVPFTGDEIWTRCRWKEKDDVRALSGKTIEIAFRLSSAKIFGYRFTG